MLNRFIFLLFLSASAWGQARIDCSQLQSRILNQSVRYCVMLPAGYDAADKAHPAKKYPVIYYLHGLGDNEQTLFRSGGFSLWQDLREQHKVSDFLMVAPEGRASFYVNSADKKVLYSDFFLQEFMPSIERKYRVRADRKSRAISGVSMGGYGALRLAFSHPELFGSVSAQSAALAPKSTSPNQSFARFLGAVFGNPFDLAHWKRNDPLELAEKNGVRLRNLAIYLNCGRDDQYGFAKGAKALDELLSAKGIRHEFHLYSGDHSARYFLGHIAETLEFHSRVFEQAK
jgi:S-formylglutathione hydrolase FrmB